MPTYTKRPIAVEAFRLDRDVTPPQWFTEALDAGHVVLLDDGNYAISTPDGSRIARMGCYVVREAPSELRPVQPEVFHATHEPVGGER